MAEITDNGAVSAAAEKARALAKLTEYGVNVLLGIKWGLSRQDAEDIVQETFLRFLEKKPEFYARSEDEQRTWFYTMLLSRAKDFLKWKYRKKRKFSLDRLKTFFYEPDPVHDEANKELHEWIYRLPEGQRQVAELSVVERLKKSEIAERLGIGKKQIYRLYDQTMDSLHLCFSVRRLPERQHQIVVQFVEGLKQADIGRKLGVVEEQVNALFFEAVQALHLSRSVQRLPEDQRGVVRLFAAGFAQADVGRRLEMSEEQVSALLLLAVQAL